MNRPRLLVKHHMGMGDHIVHNGMVRKIAQDYPEYQICLGTKSHYWENVKYMYRDNPQISVINVGDDEGLHRMCHFEKFDKIISSHFADGNPYHYEIFYDDAFYKLVNMDPEIKKKYFYLDRDSNLENKIYDELVTSQGITGEYLFVHEKRDYNVLIDRNRLEPNTPVVVADPKYGIFELLKVIENAKSVHVISSCFLSLFMCKKYNQNIFAHMYCDRAFLAPYIKKHDIEILL